MIQTDTEKFSFMLPPGMACGIDENERTITLKTDKATVIVRMVSGYFGGLPEESNLRQSVLNQHPGAAILQSMPCAGGGKTGWFFDLKRALNLNTILTIRHAIVPCRSGAFEFICTASSADFETQKGLFSSIIGSFQAKLR